MDTESALYQYDTSTGLRRILWGILALAVSNADVHGRLHPISQIARSQTRFNRNVFAPRVSVYCAAHGFRQNWGSKIGTSHGKFSLRLSIVILLDLAAKPSRCSCGCYDGQFDG